MNPDENTSEDSKEVTQVSLDPSSPNSEILINMESLIKGHIATIDKLSDEAKKLKEMLDDIFNNDPTYQEHDKAAKEAAKVKQNTKAQILKQPQAADLDKKIKDLKSDLKENQASLSDYLQEYARLSGVNEIEGDDGEVREIVYSAKLIKKSSIFAK
jgi:predicted RNase H-like nuclease (RuvC/YqgF family)